MASSKYEFMWQLLSTNDFKDEIPEKYHCTICKNVSIEPFAALCGCRFCFKCIKEYLKDGQKNCPGINNDCKEDYLELDVNVSRDIRAIRSIIRIRVKCPNEMCEERCDVENMSDHLRVCGMSKTKCPYENIGCQLRQISRDNVKIHYDDEWFTHSQLLVEAIDNLRNDVDQLRKAVISRVEEIYKLNEDSRIKEMTIKEMKRQIDDQRNDIDNMKYLNEKKDEEMEVMKEEFRKMIETQKKTMIEELKIKDERRDREMEVMIETQKKTMMEELKVKDEKRDREMEVMIETQQKTMMEELKIKDERKDREMEVMIETQKKRMMEELKIKDERRDREMEVMIETQKKTMMKEIEDIKQDKEKVDIIKNVKINEVQQQIREIEELKVKDEKIDREMEVMIETQKKTMMKELKIKDERRDREMEVMIETQKKTMMEELKNVKNDIVKMDVGRDLNDPKKVLFDLKENQENIKKEIRIYDEREFIWRVDNFSKMRDDDRARRVILWRYSLKLCLYLWCYGDFLGFYCGIMKGEFDDYIKWPMKHKITLSMINQDTMKVHKSREFHFESFEGDIAAFDKPKNESNNSFGDLNFTTLKYIRDSPGLLLNDSLIVSFNIDY